PLSPVLSSSHAKSPFVSAAPSERACLVVFLPRRTARVVPIAAECVCCGGREPMSWSLVGSHATRREQKLPTLVTTVGVRRVGVCSRSAPATHDARSKPRATEALGLALRVAAASAARKL